MAEQNNVVHVGLGKSGTTALQAHVFPELARLAGYAYNPAEIFNLSYKLVLAGALPETEARFRRLMADDPIFISNEALHGWQPHLFEDFAERNLRVWGENSTILISLRDPLPFQTSFFADMVQGGVYRSPEQFFLKREDFERVRHLCEPWVIDYFSVDDFDLRKMVTAYQDRFKRVALLLYETQFDLRTLAAIFDVGEDKRLKLVEDLEAAPRLRQRPMGWQIKAHLLYAQLTGNAGINVSRPLVEARMAQFLRDDGTTFEAPITIGKDQRLSARRSWKVAERILKRVMPKRKYALPPEVYQNAELTLKNRAYIAEVIAQERSAQTLIDLG